MKQIFVLALLALELTLAGCAHCHRSDKSAMNATSAAVIYASAQLTPTRGNKVSGQVSFTEEFGKLKVVADVSGLEPGTKHGFHIHEFGDCSAPDASSAGGHFNPEGHAHGSPEADPHHAGDLGNVVADAKGNAHLEIEVSGVSLGGVSDSYLGRAVIIHKSSDDLTSQPVGAAGARVACGVIGATNKPK
jgi:superoxide dismutase, Cu-Zn family